MKRPKRSKRWFVVAVLGAAMAAPGVRADDVGGRAASELDRLYTTRLNAIKNDPALSDQQKIDRIHELMAERDASMRTSGMAGRMNQVDESVRSGGQRSPGFWDKAGDAALGIVSELLKQAIQNWMNNPTKENEARIRMLEAERDRMLNERNNPTNNEAGGGSNGMGRPVYDSNGNIIGWDRDGDGRPDSTDSNGDGSPDSFNGGSSGDGYADPYEYLDGGRTGATGGTTPGTSQPVYDGSGRFIGLDTNGDGIADSNLAASGASGDVAGGGASMGAGGGAGLGGASGDEEGEDEEDEDKKDDEEDEELAAKDDAKDGVATGTKDEALTADGKKDRNRDGVADDRQMETFLGKVMILPKVDPLAAATGAGAAGSARPGQPGARPAAPAAKPLEDDWNDAADNGDRSKAPDEWSEDWGNDWGDGWSTTGGAAAPGAGPATAGGTATRPAPGAPGVKPEDAQLVDELIRVETVIAEWRKQAKEEAEGKRDPYGFHDGAGYQGADGTTQDPLADVRGPDGKIDLTRVDIWLVERDSWREGMEPRRFKVTVAEEAIETFDPINGGFLMARGVISEMKVDPRVLSEIRGSVKKLDLVQVVVSSATAPDDPAAAPGAPAPSTAPSTSPSEPPPSSGGDDW